MKRRYFSVLFYTVYAHQVPLAKMEKFILQVKHELQMLTVSYACRLSLSSMRMPSWDAITKLAHVSKCQTPFCENDLGDLTHTSGMHCHWQQTPLTQKIQNLYIFR